MKSAEGNVALFSLSAPGGGEGRGEVGAGPRSSPPRTTLRAFAILVPRA